jgi:UDP-2,3-diacylglucosamine pyrophosphatase LpxH
MKTLAISDCHIGDPRCHNNKNIRELIGAMNYDRLVLCGDIVDFWLANMEEIVQDPLLKLIEKISRGKEVIWVVGNHDYNIYKKEYNDILPNIIKCNLFETTENNKNILFIHGHQVYRHENMSWFSKLMAKINVGLYEVFGCDLQRLGQKLCCYINKIDKVRRKILDKYKNKDIIIIGHTHIVGHVLIDGRELFDIGSTAFTKTYAVIENGEVSIRYI